MPECEAGMVRGSMSTDGSENEFDSLQRAKERLRVQQRLIDISWRSLQNHRESSRDPASPSTASSSSSSSLHAYPYCCADSVPACSGHVELHSTIEEDIFRLEVSLHKLAPRDAMHAHTRPFSLARLVARVSDTCRS